MKKAAVAAFLLAEELRTQFSLLCSPAILVTIARDLGKAVGLSFGITASDRVIENPPDGIVDGQIVHIAEAGRKEGPATVGK